MSIFSKSAPYGDTSEPGRLPRKPWSAMQIMLAILGGFMVLGLLSMIHDRLHTQEADAASYPVTPAASARRTRWLSTDKLRRRPRNANFPALPSAW
jgi:hypothetical protein